MDNALQSKKVRDVIFSQLFCDQLEHIPIKKRILLRDSAMYQQTGSSDKVSDQNADSCSLAQHTDTSLSKQSSDNLMTSQLDGNERVPPCADTILSSASSFMSDDTNDGLDIKGDEHVKHLTNDITGDSYTVGKSSIQPDPCNDLNKAMQPVTQEVRIPWDLNVAVDEWGEPTDHQNVESQSYITSFDIKASTKIDKSEDLKLKRESLMHINDAQPDDTSVYSGNIFEQNHIIGESTYSLGCECVSNNQHVAASTCLKQKFSDTELSVETISMKISCNQNQSSETDEHLTPTLFESANKLPDDEPKRDSGSSFETTNYNRENINVATTGKCSDVDSDSSKRGKNAIAGELEVAFVDFSDLDMDLLKRSAYAEERDHLEPHSENVKAVVLVHHPINRMTKRSSENDDVSLLEPLSVPGHCNQDGTTFKQGVNVDKYCVDQTEDYEDGELRDIDVHSWNEMEIEMGETECLDYEPIVGNTGNLDESSASISVGGKDEDQLKSKKQMSSEILKNQSVAKDCASSDKKMTSGLCSEVYFGTRYSNVQLERKLSGWDQLPKYEDASSDKVPDVYRVSSRILRSELQGYTGKPTLSEDVVEKETVFERGIRPKDMDSSYSSESCSGFDKFSAEWRFTPHMHQVEDWVSENRSSVNYHDIYDNRSGSRPLIVYTKGLEGVRSRSPSVRSEDYDAHLNYSRYSKERYRHAEGSGRGFIGARNGHRGSLTDERGESDFCVRQQFIRGDQSYSHRATPHFSKISNMSRSRSRTRSPPMWLSRCDLMNSRGHHRSTEFGTGDRVKGTRSLSRKSSFTLDNGLHYSPPRGRFIPHNKPKWHADDDFDMRGPGDRSPVKQLRHKVILKAACPRGRFKHTEKFRPT